MKDRRETLTTDMFHYQKLQCSAGSTPHSVDHTMDDWDVTSIYADLRLSEWAQEDHVRSHDQIKPTLDGDPTAFIIGDLEFPETTVAA
jgi:hypothetical protein